MHPVVRALGKVLRLVGISSPEDAAAKKDEAGGPPSWREKAGTMAGGPVDPTHAEGDSDRKPG